MDVKLPDGTILRNVPEGTTRAQIMARYGKTRQAKGSGIGILDSALSAGNELLIGGAEGLYNAASAVTDPIAKFALEKIYGPEAAEATMSNARGQRKRVVNAAERNLVSRPNAVARTTGRIAAGAAVPVGRAGALGKAAPVVQRAIQGAIGGAAVRDVDQDAANPAAIGAVTNVALPPALRMLANSAPGRAIASGVQRVAGPAVNYLASQADDLAEATIGKLGPKLGYNVQPLSKTTPKMPPPRNLAELGPRSEARAARFKAAGVDKPTTAMVTRDPNSFAFERNTQGIQGVGDDLQSQIRDVEQSLVNKGRELVRSQGGSKGPEATGEAVQKALDDKRGEMQRVTSRLYDKVREQRGDEIVGALDSLNELINSPDVTDNATFDQMRDSLTRRMARLGGRDAMSDLPGELSVTVRQAEDLRKFIRSLGSTADPSVRMMRGQLIDALDDDVVSSVGDDAFKAARASAKARFDEFSKTFAGRIADEGIPPERLAKRVLSDSTSLSDLRAMRKSLLNGSDEQVAKGKEAWKGLRAQALDDLLSKSMNEEGKVLGGQLLRDFNKQSAKLRELLDPADYKQLRRLVLASRDATVAPPNSAVNYSNTAPALANIFQSQKPHVRDGWLKFLAKHSAAAAISFPAGNVAYEVGRQAAGSVAQQRAAAALARRVELARSPEATAAAIAALKKAANKNPAAQELLNSLGLAGSGVAASQAE